MSPVVWLFLAVPLVCRQFVIMVLSDHTHFFCMSVLVSVLTCVLSIHVCIVFCVDKCICMHVCFNSCVCLFILVSVFTHIFVVCLNSSVYVKSISVCQYMCVY